MCSRNKFFSFIPQGAEAGIWTRHCGLPPQSMTTEHASISHPSQWWLLRHFAALTLLMVRLLSSKEQGCKDFLKPPKNRIVGIHWIALTEYSQMSTHLPGFQSVFSFFLHLYVSAKLATSSIRVKYFCGIMQQCHCLQITYSIWVVGAWPYQLYIKYVLPNIRQGLRRLGCQAWHLI